MTTPHRKPPFQFRLGSLLWLILVVAILIGWYLDSTKLRRHLREQRARTNHHILRDVRSQSEIVQLEETIRQTKQAGR
jgi:cytochrome c-type biogenesis protein CcmH/NrfF